MLQLFHSIFGNGDETGRYPETLVRKAIERAVDGTDPWLRGLSGYRRKLRPAVIHAIDHVVALVDGMDASLELSREHYGHDPHLRLFFISAEQMAEVLRRDPMLSAFRREAGQEFQPAWALLVMACEQRGTFGVDLLGDTLVRDVPQVTVSMAGHRLLDPTADPAETKRQLKRRAFDHLLSLALARIGAVEHEREDLLQRRTLLQAKHDMLENSSWGFSGGVHDASSTLDEVHAELEKLEAQLFEFGGDNDYIEKHLEIVVDVLAHAERQLWVQPLVLIVDRMGIRRNAVSDDAPELRLKELHNAAGQKLVAQLVTIPSPVAAAG